MRWLISPSFSDYEVSEYGDVRRTTAGHGVRYVGYELKPYRRADGYNMFILRRAGKSWHKKAHQLVAEAFVGPKPFKAAEVCHNDGSRTNDHYSNLRWDTRSANHADKLRHGTHSRGERHPNAKLTAMQVADMRFLASEGYLQRELGYIFGLRQGYVSRVLSGQRWVS